MDLEIPIFNTKNVKRTFYYFFASNVILTLAVIIVPLVIDISFTTILGRNDNWAYFFILFGGYYYFGAKNRKELVAVWETKDIAQKFARYERYYKQKLLWNFIILVIATIILLLMSQKYFLYLLVLQSILMLIHYPGKKLLMKELQVEGIVFT